jgi:hypothetical protein
MSDNIVNITNTFLLPPIESVATYEQKDGKITVEIVFRGENKPTLMVSDLTPAPRGVDGENVAYIDYEDD